MHQVPSETCFRQIRLHGYDLGVGPQAPSTPPARPHGRSNDYTLKRQVPRQYVYDYRRREDREFNYFHNASCTTTVAWVRQDVEYHYVGQVHLRQDRCPNKHRLHGLRQVPLPTTPNIYRVCTIARCEPLLLIPSSCTTTSSTNLIRSEKSRLEGITRDDVRGAKTCVV